MIGLCSRLFWAGLLVSHGICAYGDRPDATYRSGVEAFRSGDYERAAAAFEMLEMSGASSPRVHFNLASTYFRLGRMEDARERFERISNDAEWRDLARYNLGLIAEREGRRVEALRHFEWVLANAKSDRLRLLATPNVERLSGVYVAAPRRWFGLVSVGVGFDDNVVLSDDPSIIGVTDEQDQFADVLAAASRYLIGDYDTGVRLDLSAAAERYRELDEFDGAAASLGLIGVRPARGWQLEGGLRADVDTLGNELLTTTGSVTFRARRAVGSRANIQLRGDSSWVDGGSQYDYLSGWRQRLAIEVHHRRGPADARLGYALELNARGDFETPDETLSYSPLRQSAYVRFERRFVEGLSAEVRLEYRASDYRDDDTVLDENGVSVERRREDDRLTVGARLNIRVLAPTDLFVDYRWVDNDSTVDAYRYTQSRAVVGVEYAF